MDWSDLWIAPVPAVAGEVGSGPVDLSSATQELLRPPGSDLPGSAGEMLDRAYRWFLDAADAASGRPEQIVLLVDAARTMNNLAVWCLTRWGHPNAAVAARDALLEADRLLSVVAPAGVEVRGGVYFNLGTFAAATGALREALRYFGLARSAGHSVPDRVPVNLPPGVDGAPPEDAAPRSS